MSPANGREPPRDSGTARTLTPGDRIGTVGDDDGSVAGAVVAAGGEPTVELDNIAAVVTVGTDPLTAVATADLSVPILPVGADLGVRPVPRGSLEQAIATLFTSEWTTATHPVVAVEWPTGDGRAVADVALLVSEPGHLSEFGVRSRDRRIGRVRADGIVAALPAGSHAYASAAGGPTVAATVDVTAVVPIVPYAVDPDHWILPPSELELTVEREETPVSMILDGRSTGELAVPGSVAIDRIATFRTIEVPASRPIRGGLETP